MPAAALDEMPSRTGEPTELVVMPNAETVARLLEDLEQGRDHAFDDLFSLLYEELRALAQRQRRRWPGQETLNTTALVHEAYVKLAPGHLAGWRSEAHFLAAASRAIRHILINYARDGRAQKRGGGWRRVTLGEADGADGPTVELSILIALDDALRRLGSHSERLSRIVECRFFGGMSIAQTAASLDVSTATVSRGWATAQAWLHRELGDLPGDIERSREIDR